MALHHVRATISVGQAHITLVPIARSAIYVAIPLGPPDHGPVDPYANPPNNQLVTGMFCDNASMTTP